ncbi:MAG: PIG-L family deacetylase [bacterium]
MIRSVRLLLIAVMYLWPTAVGLCLEADSGETVKEPENVLYIFAHQDDETDIIAKMAMDLRRGRAVHVVWITDGALFVPAQVREKESRSVMERIGVPQENLVFLGYPDMGAYKHLEEIFNDLLKIAERLKPAEIISMAYEGGHIDHDVTSLMAALLTERIPGAAHYEFSSSNMYQGKLRVNKLLPREDSVTLYTPLDKELYDLRMDVLKMYPSQTLGLSLLDSVTDKREWKEKGEAYRLSPKYDYTKRPVEGPLGYEAAVGRPRARFDEWRKNVAAFLNKI